MNCTIGARDINPKVGVVVVVFLTTLSKESRILYNTMDWAKQALSFEPHVYLGHLNRL